MLRFWNWQTGGLEEAERTGSELVWEKRSQRRGLDGGTPLAVGTQERKADDEQERKTPYDASKPQYTRRKRPRDLHKVLWERWKRAPFWLRSLYSVGFPQPTLQSTTLIIFDKIRICKCHNNKKRQSHWTLKNIFLKIEKMMMIKNTYSYPEDSQIKSPLDCLQIFIIF